MNTDLYLIIRLLKDVIPDDISNKILLLLLGIARTPSASCFQSAYKEYVSYVHNVSCGKQYEIKYQTSYNQVQKMVMYNIRIAQFDGDCGKKRSVGAIKNIKNHMKLLEVQFKQRHRRIFC
jgi:hypothetical protein